jgi:hypothetical protein
LTDYMIRLVRPLSSNLWTLVAVIFDTLTVTLYVCVSIRKYTRILFGVSVCVRACVNVKACSFSKTICSTVL